EIGNGHAVVYPGTYKEFLWHKEHPQEVQKVQGVQEVQKVRKVQGVQKVQGVREVQEVRTVPKVQGPDKPGDREAKKRADAEARRRQRADQARRAEIEKLESEIAECELAIRQIEEAMAAPGFYEDREASQTAVDRHQSLMWKVGDLMHRW